MSNYKRIGRPGQIGSRKDEIYHNYNKVFGENKWRFAWDVNGASVDLNGALTVYEDSYADYFRQHPSELEWIAKNFANVYDNNPSNVSSGFDYAVQEFGGNHFQDISVRRCLVRNGLWFQGKDLLEVRSKGAGKRFGPSEIAFHKPEWIPQPELKGWWKPGSIESWYQSAKYLEAENPPELNKDMYFVTSNVGKVNSLRVALGNEFSVDKITLDIKEELDDVEKIAAHKAKVAYAVLCRPVICDDSGFVIPSLDGYPGHHAGRELQEKGIEHFLALAKKPLDAYFIMTLSYMDEALERPKLFTSKVEGKLIGEQRGDATKPHIKSLYGAAFVINGQDKTIAEMTEDEYKKYASSDRWKAVGEFLRDRF